jgi:hypothetical protein
VALETVAIPALDVKKAREIDSAPPSHFDVQDVGSASA